MRWKDLQSDISLGKVDDLLRELDGMSALGAVANMVHGVRIYALRSCLESVLSHVRSGKGEVGGLVLGRVYQVRPGATDPAGDISVLTEAFPSLEYRNSSVSLAMGAEVWSRIGEAVSTNQGTIVIGWYHSHPGLGAFFSGTDRKTQSAFFDHHYSMGWVIDPVRDEQKLFIGPEAEEYKHTIVALNHGFDWAPPKP